VIRAFTRIWLAFHVFEKKPIGIPVTRDESVVARSAHGEVWQDFLIDEALMRSHLLAATLGDHGGTSGPKALDSIDG
jgi:hypothetical protein